MGNKFLTSRHWQSQTALFWWWHSGGRRRRGRAGRRVRGLCRALVSRRQAGQRLRVGPRLKICREREQLSPDCLFPTYPPALLCGSPGFSENRGGGVKGGGRSGVRAMCFPTPRSPQCTSEHLSGDFQTPSPHPAVKIVASVNCRQRRFSKLLPKPRLNLGTSR